MLLRKLTENDLDLYKEIRLEGLQESPSSFGSSYEEEILYTKSDWLKFFESDLFGTFDLDGNLLGVAGFYVSKGLKLQHKGFVFGMYVRTERRGKGLGKALLEEVILHARNRVSYLYLNCEVNNISALNLYKSQGFEIYGTEKNAIKVEDHFLDQHLMVLTL